MFKIYDFKNTDGTHNILIYNNLLFFQSFYGINKKDFEKYLKKYKIHHKNHVIIKI